MSLQPVLLSWGSFIFGLCVLGFVSVLDFKTRRVSNWVWVFAYPIGCAMTLAGIALDLVGASVVLVSLGGTLFLGLVLVCSGFYGSADVKALIFIGLTTPTVPVTVEFALGVSALPVVLVVFCNSALLSLIWPISIFILNLKDLLKREPMFEGITLTIRQKILLLFTARLIPIDKFGELGYFPAETVVVVVQDKEHKPTRKLLRLVKAETDLEKYQYTLKKYSTLYPNGVLASPTIPTMVFFTLALAIAPLGHLVFLVGCFLV